MCTINHNSNVLFLMHNKPITTQNSVFAFFSLIIINIVFTFQGAEARRLWKLIMIYYVLQRDLINFFNKFSTEVFFTEFLFLLPEDGSSKMKKKMLPVCFEKTALSPNEGSDKSYLFSLFKN